MLLAAVGSADDFVCCGFGAEIWRVREGVWHRLECNAAPMPLSTIARGADDQFFIAGRGGTLIEVRDTSARLIEWKPASRPKTNLLRGLGDLWGVAFFKGRLYVSSLRG